jgi:hypothetical protein
MKEISHRTQLQLASFLQIVPAEDGVNLLLQHALSRLIGAEIVFVSLALVDGALGFAFTLSLWLVLLLVSVLQILLLGHAQLPLVFSGALDFALV